ncbi:protein kinase [Epibacterium sp. SM1969]|uniref:Protein kinase n=1 Tax=Tritonibacter aquimaris TaxID=2663379 RepID=A0A844AMS6_9RHOB|nr:serine/threonine-protein kinase [Tritonibacter aquimaris]MQY43670.1 protein kinase [Tritonibacter aquimaris]
MQHKTCTQTAEATCSASDHARALSRGATLLQGQYQIERQLLAGGFGLTYLARDSLDRQVVIKECFPAEFGFREGNKVATPEPYQAKCFKTVLRHFLREAQWLAQASHPNVVAVHQVFKENNTAYIAMDFIEGEDLVNLRARQPERFDQLALSQLLDQALRGLHYLHEQGILHRDVSPDNFLLDQEGHLTLIDFGAACSLSNEDDTALGALLSVKDGYSPHELYHTDMRQRASSDLYALGATFYFLVSGTPPPQATTRLKAVTGGEQDPCALLSETADGFDRGFLASIDKAMSILPGARFQNAAEWRDSLPEELKPSEAESTTEPMPAQDPQQWDSIQEALADLVARTNQDLKPPRKRHQAKEEPVQSSPPRQMVDLFGEPIEDVDGWLSAQDRAARKSREASVAAPSDQITPPATQNLRSASLAETADTRTDNWGERIARIWGGNGAKQQNGGHARGGMHKNGKTA